MMAKKNRLQHFSAKSQSKITLCMNSYGYGDLFKLESLEKPALFNFREQSLLTVHATQWSPRAYIAGNSIIARQSHNEAH